MLIETIPVGALQSNCYLVADTNTKEAIVIDPGDEATVILNRISQQSLTVQAILLTHAHFDHIGHSNRIKDILGCKIYLHKDDLFLYVLERAYEKIRSHEEKLDLENLVPEDAVRELVKFTFSYHHKNPEFMRLLNNENLYKAEHIKKSKKIKQMHSPFVELITDVLKRGENAGVFRKNVDPVQFYVTVASVAYFYLSNVYTLSHIFGRKFSK